jgi:hypothetical protein
MINSAILYTFLFQRQCLPNCNVATWRSVYRRVLTKAAMKICSVRQKLACDLCQYTNTALRIALYGVPYLVPVSVGYNASIAISGLRSCIRLEFKNR